MTNAKAWMKLVWNKSNLNEEDTTEMKQIISTISSKKELEPTMKSLNEDFNYEKYLPLEYNRHGW